MNGQGRVVTRAEIEARARDLLDALDRMHGSQSLSQNVLAARGALRLLLPRASDPRDRAEKAA